MATKRAYIYKDAAGSIRVFPPVTVLKPKDSFELVNTLKDEARWSVGDGVFDGGAVNGDPVPRHGRSAAKTAKDAPFLVATYEVKIGIFKAVANSDPVIIIDP